MTIRQLLTHRRDELVYFLNWRFGTRYWTTPFCYLTGLPRWLAQKLRCRAIEFATNARPSNKLTIRDIFRAEDAALHLGFRPTLPKKSDRRYLKPPPPNLPPHTHPSIRIRYRQWQKENPRDKIPKAERIKRREEREREAKKIWSAAEGNPAPNSPQREQTSDQK